MVGVWVFLPMAKIFPSLKHVRFLDLPITEWVVIVYVMSGFYILSYWVYFLVHDLITSVAHDESKLHIAQALSDIIDSLIFWWTELMVTGCVPAFKHHEILGLRTQKWIEVSVLVVIGFNVITLFTRVTVWLLRYFLQNSYHDAKNDSLTKNIPGLDVILGKHLQKGYLVYGANGMRRSINFMLSSLLLVLTWVYYFGSLLSRTDEGKHIWEFGKRTLICLLMCSFLWSIKSLVLLTWEVHTVYGRLYSRILNINEQLYFLGVLGRCNHDILSLQCEIEVDHEGAETEGSNISSSQGGSLLHKFQKYFPATFTHFLKKRVEKKKSTAKKREKVRNDFLKLKDKNPTMDDVQRVARYFLAAKTTLLVETYTSDVLKILDSSGNNRENLKRLISWESRSTSSCTSTSENPHIVKIIWEIWKQFCSWLQRYHVIPKPSRSPSTKGSSVTQRSNDGIWKNDWDHFVRELLKNEADSSETSFTNIRTWVVRAHNNCMFLANTLSNAKEVADCLNSIIGGILIGVSFIMWLFLTRVATTKVVVLVASPLLAATFIFGDTCKTLFEGFFFIYVVHPFDVGDLCVIDEKMLEVTSIGVWTTTFSNVDKIGLREAVNYPNSDLARKIFTNYKTEFDWSDYVEFDLSSLARMNLNELEEEIEDSRINKDSFDFLPSSHSVTMSAMEDNVKLIIRLKFKAENTKDWTYFECLQRKDKLRAGLYLYIQNIIQIFKPKFPIQNKIKGNEQSCSQQNNRSRA
ncbi:mechanosensitive ion channel protein 10-like isoform X1 [Spinacia oleracea]|uniref:Mechanosensitive ion channel protein 10-like isoform X1 n=2 Tax=Spinacia oleracea TaxID=3562 RepID=A0A9R0J2S2_SPIOL|nr:mechanosensitive ion channel protein 10-like isoform X1 [Spinacia oleracea]XP_021859473.1 mechanosensitive ion channel protein 10-like isoform X1 [Spinacia oleracea]